MAHAYREAVAVELPGGLVRDDGRRIGWVELRPVTGREEDWLANHPETPVARAVTELLGACIVEAESEEPGRELARQLLTGDRDYLMLQLRRLTNGDRVQAVIDCPACGAKMDVDFLASDVAVESRPQSAGSYLTEVPGNGRPIRFRLPNGGDQESVTGMSTAGAVERLIERCVLEGAPLNSEERDAVTAAMEARAPLVDLELDLECPECGRRSVVPFDVSGLFVQEMTERRRHLLGEVHSLAIYYHWSETEILGMARSRRRAYLELLSDALRD